MFKNKIGFLVGLGIESISLNPDSIIKTMLVVGEKEKEKQLLL